MTRERARIAFLILALANLVAFAWMKSGFGDSTEGREPKRLAEQLFPERIRIVAVREATPVAAASADPAGCRGIEGPERLDLERVLAAATASGTALRTTLQQREGATTWTVVIPGLISRALAERKATEIKQLGIASHKVIEDAKGGGFAISFGQFASEQQAADLLADITRKGVRSARREAREKSSERVWLELRGPQKLLDALVPELITGIPGAQLRDCS
jgi:hypothetical protein